MIVAFKLKTIATPRENPRPRETVSQVGFKFGVSFWSTEKSFYRRILRPN